MMNRNGIGEVFLTRFFYLYKKLLEIFKKQTDAKLNGILDSHLKHSQEHARFNKLFLQSLFQIEAILKIFVNFLVISGTEP